MSETSRIVTTHRGAFGEYHGKTTMADGAATVQHGLATIAHGSVAEVLRLATK